MRIMRYIIISGLFLAAALGPSAAFAAPEILMFRVADVTTRSFSAVWITDAQGAPGVKVYDKAGNEITGKLRVEVMPAGRPEVAAAALAKGVIKVRIAGLEPASEYFVKAVMTDASGVGYSVMHGVTTAARVEPYTVKEGRVEGFANELVAFGTYIRPADMNGEPGIGDLVIFETPGAKYPISAFVGDWIVGPEGIMDANNFFNADGKSLEITGSEKMVISVYRKGVLSLLEHYRRFPEGGDICEAVKPMKGFFADVNLDGNVDESDFGSFKEHYRTAPNDVFYNPDFNFAEDTDGIVDVRDFSKFSKQYGLTGIE